MYLSVGLTLALYSLFMQDYTKAEAIHECNII